VLIDNGNYGLKAEEDIVRYIYILCKTSGHLKHACRTLSQHTTSISLSYKKELSLINIVNGIDITKKRLVVQPKSLLCTAQCAATSCKSGIVLF